MKSQVVENVTSPFSRLPDDIALEIFKKVIDFKTLSFCKLVCKSFNRIVHKVDTVSFNAPSDWITCGEILRNKLLAFTASSEPRLIGYTPSDDGASSLLSAIQSMTKFTRLKNLRVELPPVPSLEEGIYKHCLFKWKAIISINGIDSFAFISPGCIYDIATKTLLHPDYYDVAENGGIAYKKLRFDKSEISDECLTGDVMVRYWMLLCFTIDFLLLEKVSIMDSLKRGRMSLSGAKLAEVRNGLNSGSQTFEQRPAAIRGKPGFFESYNYLLGLSVSRFVMRNVTLFLAKRGGLPVIDFDCFSNIDDDDFEDIEESAYTEVVMEFYKRFRKTPHIQQT